jgi:serine/threonine protein kinase
MQSTRLGYCAGVQYLGLNSRAQVAPRPRQVTVGMGTPGYAAPEVHAAGSMVGVASDIFGLGVTMYEV